jgi:hypothetical protein
MRRSQFDIDVLRPWQKSQEQFTAMLSREFIGAAFGRMARGDNERRAQDRHLRFELVFLSNEMIEPKLEQIRRIRHSGGQAQFGQRCDHAHKRRILPSFDRSVRCHILFRSEKREEFAPSVVRFLACLHEDRN